MNKAKINNYDLTENDLELDEYGRAVIKNDSKLEKMVGGAGEIAMLPDSLSNGACINASC